MKDGSLKPPTPAFSVQSAIIHRCDLAQQSLKKLMYYEELVIKGIDAS